MSGSRVNAGSQLSSWISQAGGGPSLDVCRLSMGSLRLPQDPRRQSVAQTRGGLRVLFCSADIQRAIIL